MHRPAPQAQRGAGRFSVACQHIHTARLAPTPAVVGGISCGFPFLMDSSLLRARSPHWTRPSASIHVGLLDGFCTSGKGRVVTSPYDRCRTPLRRSGTVSVSGGGSRSRPGAGGWPGRTRDDEFNTSVPFDRSVSSSRPTARSTCSTPTRSERSQSASRRLWAGDQVRNHRDGARARRLVDLP